MDQNAVMSTQMRLNKFLAERLGLSRREADNLIAAGRVTIDKTKAALGARVLPSDLVELDGRAVENTHRATYLALHKPVGYVCSRKRQDETPTIYELLPEQYQKLKSVGRLDKNSSGLILLSDDGDFAFRMTHPKFAKTKLYEVELDRDLAPLHQQMIADFGVRLEDGLSKLNLSRVERAEELNLSQFEPVKLNPEERRWFKVSMNEGRNRQIRRTFAALGYQVVRLHRVEFGTYRLDALAPGKIAEFELR